MEERVKTKCGLCGKTEYAYQHYIKEITEDFGMYACDNCQEDICQTNRD